MVRDPRRLGAQDGILTSPISSHVTVSMDMLSLLSEQLISAAQAPLVVLTVLALMLIGDLATAPTSR